MTEASAAGAGPARRARRRPARGLASLLLAVALGAGAAAQAAGQAAARQTLRQEIESLAVANGFVVLGAEHIAAARPNRAGGDLETRLAKLLADYDFIVVRDEGGRIKRLTIVGSRAPRGEVARSDVVPTVRSSLGHVVEATVTGVGGAALTAQFLLDTGASTVVMPVSSMASLGLSPNDTEPTTLHTANGPVEGRVGSLPSVRVGSSDATDVAVAFLPNDRLGDKYLLGMSFLSRFVVTIDDENGRLTLSPRPR